MSWQAITVNMTIQIIMFDTAGGREEGRLKKENKRAEIIKLKTQKEEQKERTFEPTWRNWKNN